MRVCDRCGLEAKTLEELEGVFVRSKTCKYGFRSRCHSCQGKEIKSKYYRTREGRRESEIRLRYNIELEEYNRCMATSKECQICGSKDKLCYDHDHDTLEFRGVLCRKCNSGLGMLNDDKRLVEKALNYMTEKTSMSLT